jgi:hypothetical protein
MTETPYPTSEAEVTAETLARSLTDQANRLTNTVVHSDKYDELHGSQILVINRSWAVVYMLRELLDAGQTELADRLAVVLWGAWEIGDEVGELLYQWAGEYGLNPDAEVLEHQAR